MVTMIQEQHESMAKAEAEAKKRELQRQSSSKLEDKARSRAAVERRPLVEEETVWFKRLHNHTLVQVRQQALKKQVLKEPAIKSWSEPSDGYLSVDVDDAHYQLYANQRWADPDNSHDLLFNEWDKKRSVNRISLTGPYPVSESRPLNPTGRVGLCGRGVLPFWGPNHCVHVLITRWKRDDKDNIVKREGRPIMQVMLAGDKTRIVQLPWFVLAHHNSCDNCYCVTTLIEIFIKSRIEELTIDKPPREVRGYEILSDLITTISSDVVYRGYLEDPLNTDNAWLETVALNLHELYNNRFGDLLLEVFQLNKDDKIYWADMGERRMMRTGHREFQKILAQRHEASY